MPQNGWKRLLIEGWAFVVVAALAFVVGLLIGDLGGSPKTETVFVSTPPSKGEEAGAPKPSGEATEGAEGGESEQEGAANGSGAQIFTATGCGSCHTLAAAETTGKTGPNLDEFLAPDDNTEAVEEMIVDPNAELAEGYPPNVMPTSYGQTLAKSEIHQLAEYLVATTPAKPSPVSSSSPKPKSESKSSSVPSGGGAGEALHLAASPTQLAFDTKELTGKSGKVTIDSTIRHRSNTTLQSSRTAS